MSTRIIRRLFSARLAVWAQGAGIPVAWENVPFDPPATSYLRFHVLPASVDSRDLAGAHRQYVGLVQITVVTPTGSGPDSAESIAESLYELFPLNLCLTLGGFVVQTVTPLSATPIVQDEDRCVVSARFRYQADTV